MSCTCDMPVVNGARRGPMHCRKCCVTFTGISAFDHHIVEMVHHAPGERGLVARQRRLGTVWGWPGERPHEEVIAHLEDVVLSGDVDSD